MPRLANQRTSKKQSPVDRGIAEGYRSGLESAVHEQLRAKGCEAKFEPIKIEYLKPQKASKYTPDFVLPNGIIIETKGRFVTADRQKHLLIQAQHPELDIRFVFSRANDRISKQSKTTYAMWCEKHGFLYSDKGVVPDNWLTEKAKP